MRAEVTELLLHWNNGDSSALEKLLPLVYEELRRMAELYMRRERSSHTLQPTALVHEAYLRLIDQTRVEWRNRAHFFGVAAQLMRRVTVKHAERHRAAKRGGGGFKVQLDEEIAAEPGLDTEVLALDEALRRLEAIDQRQARIVEMRFFGGLKVEEVSQVLEVSAATVFREQRMALAWLKRELDHT